MNISAWIWRVIKTLNPNQTNLIITPTEAQAEQALIDLKFFLGDSVLVQHFMNWDTLPYEALSPSTEIQANRLSLINNLLRKKNICVITSQAALRQKLVQTSLEHNFFLRIGQTLNLADFEKKLLTLGYQKTRLVQKIGDFSWHGKVIDFLPVANQLNAQFGVRVEFFETKILSIRYFDRQSQRTKGRLEMFEVIPVREVLIETPENLNKKIEKLKAYAQAKDLDARSQNNLIAELTRYGFLAPLGEQYSALVCDNLVSLLDLLPVETNLYPLQIDQLESELEKLGKIIFERYQKTKLDHLFLPPEQFYLTENEFFESFERYNQPFLQSKRIDQVSDILDLQAELKISPENIKQVIQKLSAQKFQVNLTAETELRAERLETMLKSYGISRQIFHSGFNNNPKTVEVPIYLGRLAQGFRDSETKQIFITESEIFGKVTKRKKIVNAEVDLKKILSTLSLLVEGDFVVHEDYGLAKYQGLKKIKLSNFEGEFIELQYADSKLLLPVHNIGRVQKFSGPEDQTPELSKLGSPKWQQTKAKVYKAVSTLAGDLLKLYAARSQATGESMNEIGALDSEFADYFPYDETADQLSAINETLKDLTSGRPMDRLICGDVGFGKTEVALRAAFKCALSGKQVAVLAPTTILVDQHLNTFKERFANFPVKIGAVSRFYPAAENKKTLALAIQGKLDILIGTQKILQRDVEFKDLGLLIIDEEHRFGVKDKEKLKQFKKKVHVLTLTATPIPRTLYMSLINIRDVSVIRTAPTDRHAVHTFLASYDDDLVRSAILKELQRNGQVFYLHNRVETIEQTTAKLKLLVPEARFKFAHGQMPEHDLEKIMHEFINHNFDVLVTTTIVESGIDIANANTLIIERADKLGLAQLYQLRGRVGRSTRQAYAYLLVPELKNMTAGARERLEALKSIDDLGQGFQLALRDLEIRGAGNLLGKEQAGNLFLVGYDLYTKLLQEAVVHLKSEDLPHLIEPEIRVDLAAFIPDDFIPDPTERLILYQRLSSLTTTEEGAELLLEISDRFGATPPPVDTYVDLMQLKCWLRQIGIIEFELRNDAIILKPYQRSRLDFDKLIKLAQTNSNLCRVSPSRIITFSLKKLKK